MKWKKAYDTLRALMVGCTVTLQLKTTSAWVAGKEVGATTVYSVSYSGPVNGRIEASTLAGLVELAQKKLVSPIKAESSKTIAAQDDTASNVGAPDAAKPKGK